MQNVIKKYAVQHPLLKRYVKFFWEIHADFMKLDHKIIPVRNIDLKFNLSDTPHYVCTNGREYLLEQVYFAGLRDHFTNSYLKLNGKVHVLGVCFLPEGLFAFLKIPVSEFKNQILGASEVGFDRATAIQQRLTGVPDVAARLNIIENELLSILDNNQHIPESFRRLFNALKQNNNSLQLDKFCLQNNISKRKLERMYNKYVGVSAKTYAIIDRFQNSLNQLLYKSYDKLSDIAYGNEYFDQMHFIREFKRFAGNTPKSFLHQNDSMLQIGKLV